LIRPHVARGRGVVVTANRLAVTRSRSQALLAGATLDLEKPCRTASGLGFQRLDRPCTAVSARPGSSPGPIQFSRSTFCWGIVMGRAPPIGSIAVKPSPVFRVPRLGCLKVPRASGCEGFGCWEWFRPRVCGRPSCGRELCGSVRKVCQLNPLIQEVEAVNETGRGAQGGARPYSQSPAQPQPKSGRDNEETGGNSGKFAPALEAQGDRPRSADCWCWRMKGSRSLEESV